MSWLIGPLGAWPGSMLSGFASTLALALSTSQGVPDRGPA